MTLKNIMNNLLRQPPAHYEFRKNADKPVLVIDSGTGSWALPRAHLVKSYLTDANTFRLEFVAQIVTVTVSPLESAAGLLLAIMTTRDRLQAFEMDQENRIELKRAITVTKKAKYE